MGSCSQSCRSSLPVRSAPQGLAEYLFDLRRLHLRQLRELFRPRASGEFPLVLLQEAPQQTQLGVWHIELRLHLIDKPVVRLQILHFRSQIVFNSFRDAAVKKFGMPSDIEIPVVIRRFVQHVDIAVGSRSPIDQIQQPS
jgi:hypothetical protein